jgi:hypothetical protein
MAPMKEGLLCLGHRQPTQFVFCLCQARRLVRQLGYKEHRLHSVMALVCGGVKILHGFAYLAKLPSVARQFLADLTEDGIFWTFVGQ